ncbi:MAG: TetR/AcrR family transcriptional regulator [Oscillospiraceae bacterium]|jgi:AcrR family transcriptional regulator|nr:TetR/AcrR family transcriptional regulator [Oscillospiraceae bacterium]
MRKFLSLPQEKQDKIVEAAMYLFGEVGYKKAYISEIASAAGISKALMFHYFGSKKGLYSYLVYYTGKIVLTEAQQEKDTVNKDFFERAIITIKFRLAIKSRYPAMNLFMDSVYNEDDPEAASDIDRLMAIAKDMHSKVELSSDEESSFKDGIDSKYVVHLVEKYSEGIIHSLNDNIPIEETVLKVTKCMNMLKNNFCR